MTWGQPKSCKWMYSDVCIGYNSLHWLGIMGIVVAILMKKVKAGGFTFVLVLGIMITLRQWPVLVTEMSIKNSQLEINQKEIQKIKEFNLRSLSRAAD